MQKVEFSLKGDFNSREVYLNGQLLDPLKSQSIINHSPDGFAWGYRGSGPAQLALSICLELFGKEVALKEYQKFKDSIICCLPEKHFDLNLYYYV